MPIQTVIPRSLNLWIWKDNPRVITVSSDCIDVDFGGYPLELDEQGCPIPQGCDDLPNQKINLKIWLRCECVDVESTNPTLLYVTVTKKIRGRLVETDNGNAVIVSTEKYEMYPNRVFGCADLNIANNCSPVYPYDTRDDIQSFKLQVTNWLALATVAKGDVELFPLFNESLTPGVDTCSKDQFSCGQSSGWFLRILSDGKIIIPTFKFKEDDIPLNAVTAQIIIAAIEFYFEKNKVKLAKKVFDILINSLLVSFEFKEDDPLVYSFEKDIDISGVSVKATLEIYFCKKKQSNPDDPVDPNFDFVQCPQSIPSLGKPGYYYRSFLRYGSGPGDYSFVNSDSNGYFGGGPNTYADYGPVNGVRVVNVTVVDGSTTVDGVTVTYSNEAGAYFTSEWELTRVVNVVLVDNSGFLPNTLPTSVVIFNVENSSKKVRQNPYDGNAGYGWSEGWYPCDMPVCPSGYTLNWSTLKCDPTPCSDGKVANYGRYVDYNFNTSPYVNKVMEPRDFVTDRACVDPQSLLSVCLDSHFLYDLPARSVTLVTYLSDFGTERIDNFDFSERSVCLPKSAISTPFSYLLESCGVGKELRFYEQQSPEGITTYIPYCYDLQTGVAYLYGTSTEFPPGSTNGGGGGGGGGGVG